MKSHVIAPLVIASSILVSGCQTQALLNDADEALVITSPALSHLPDSAAVEISYLDAAQKNIHTTINGIRHFPYYYPITRQASSKAIQFAVKVRVEGDVVLSGRSEVKEGNSVELTSAVVGVDLQNTYWRAIDLSGRGILPSIETTLAFSEGNRLIGQAGCNRYQSTFRKSSVFIEVDKAASTRKLCASSIMYHENRYLKLLNKAERFSFKGKQLAIYVSDAESPLLFAPVTPQDVQVSMRSY
jgi:heat shock protein HslJ